MLCGSPGNAKSRLVEKDGQEIPGAQESLHKKPFQPRKEERLLDGFATNSAPFLGKVHLQTVEQLADMSCKIFVAFTSSLTLFSVVKL